MTDFRRSMRRSHDLRNTQVRFDLTTASDPHPRVALLQSTPHGVVAVSRLPGGGNRTPLTLRSPDFETLLFRMAFRRNPNDLRFCSEILSLRTATRWHGYESCARHGDNFGDSEPWLQVTVHLSPSARLSLARTSRPERTQGCSDPRYGSFVPSGEVKGQNRPVDAVSSAPEGKRGSR